MMFQRDYIRQSLGINLFFARIMKEHLIFISAAFVPNQLNLVEQADQLQNQYSHLLAETVALSNGVVDPGIIASGELVTQYTLDAERATEFLAGIPIDTGITEAELRLVGSPNGIDMPFLCQRVFNLNQRAIALTTSIIQFKEYILNNVRSCKLFTHNYPLLIEHIMREARLYRRLLCKLQSCHAIDLTQDILEQEAFWNQIMAEHSKFIRGLLDPTEEQLFDIANNFGNQFDQLTKEARKAHDDACSTQKVTEESLRATQDLRDFKAQGTQGLLLCEIQSVAFPLLGDHVLREANHYLRLLTIFKQHIGSPC